MCGIAGVAGVPGGSETEQRVRLMLGALARRGPDGEGVTSWDGAVLGHRRLAIFDLSDLGRQPMQSGDGRIGITFNGAIYNFKELRAQLRDLGFAFHSQTDTEVLVNGYIAWGIDALVERLHGMFAFAIWDARTSTLHLVRDRLGVKPLLYAQRNGAIAFASTAAALHAAGYAADLDDAAIAEFLEYGFVTDARCIYQGIRKLPAAHIATWTGEELRIREYWRPATEDAQEAIGFEEALEETERLLLRAVEMRLQADVPVGALLSGGIDSSLVCWAIARLGGDITAYTVGTPGDVWDETSDARKTAEELGIRHVVLEAMPESSPGVPDLVHAYGEPFACASALGMLGVSETVRREATVLLTGDGGDDVFLGYPRHRHFSAAQRLARALPPGSDAAWSLARKAVPQRGALRRGTHFLDYATGGLGAVVHVHDGLPGYRNLGLLGERLRGASVAARSLPRSLRAGKDVLNDFLQYERATRFAGEYLTKVDGGTMYYGLEARSPFLDQELWNFASRLPYSVRLASGKLKAILRELARRRISPRVADGAKRGFGIPAQRWMSGRWNAAALAAFDDSLLAAGGWIDGEAARRAISSLQDGQTAPVQLWHLWILEAWLQARSQAYATAGAVPG